MSDETDAAARRYARDMRRIREDRDVSIEDIHEDTRIAQTLIESFEDSSLYDHPSFNRIYLRSFIRVYAEAIELPADEALEALDAALEGTYQNELSDRYLGEGRIDQEEEPATQFSSTESSSGSDGKDEDEGASASEQSSESDLNVTPPAGGISGRGSIVGPVRAVGESGETSSEEGSTDSDQSPFDSSRSHSEEERSTEEEESPNASPSPSDDDSRESSSPATHRPSDDFSIEGEEEEPIGSPVPDNDSASEGPDLSSSVETEEGGTQDPGAAASTEEGHSPPDSLPQEDVEPHLAGGVSGIVGGPKELGSSSEAPPTSASAEPTSMGPSRAPRPAQKTSSEGLWERRRREILISGLGILVLIGVLTGLSLYYTDTEPPKEEAARSDATEDTSQTVAVQDTSATTTPTERRPPASLTLGDTLTVIVFAESALSEMRVQRDGDLRRPYWIEEGEAAVFPFTSRITFQNDLEDARFYLERYPYPSPQQADFGRIVIERETVEAFADTLRGEPHTLSVPLDTIPIRNPIPGGS